MEIILELNKKVVAYKVKEKVATCREIKSDIRKNEVVINHYTVEDNNLRKVYGGEHDVLIREELDRNGNTLLIEAFITENEFKKGEFTPICNLLAKRALRVVA